MKLVLLECYNDCHNYLMFSLAIYVILHYKKNVATRAQYMKKKTQ